MSLDPKVLTGCHSRKGMRRRALLASVLAASGSIAGCSSATLPGSGSSTKTPRSSGPPGDTTPTGQFQYDAHHTGVSDTTAPKLVNQRWRSRISPTDGGLSVADGRVVVAGGGSLVALSVDGGDQLWDAGLAHDVLAPPTLTGDTAYVTGWSAGDWEGGAVAVDLATGGESWRALPDQDVSSAVTLADDTVYVGGALDDPSVVALDAVDGREQWRVEAGEYAPTPAVADGLAIAGGGEQSVVYGLDAVMGTERWRVDVDGSVWGAPTVVDGRVYVGTRAGSVYALSVADGTRQWRVPVGDDLRGSLAVADGTVYAPDIEGGALHAVSTEGEEQWSTTSESSVYAPTVAGDAVVYTDRFRAYCLDAAGGDERWQFTPRDRQMSDMVFTGVQCPLAVHDGEVYVASSGGDVSALGPSG